MTTKVVQVSGDVVAIDVSAEEYMAKYAETRHEWVRGVVIKVAGASADHYRVVKYLRIHIWNAGQLAKEPYVLRLAHSRREPDVMVILDNNPGEKGDNMFQGAADLCVEVVSSRGIMARNTRSMKQRVCRSIGLRLLSAGRAE